MPSMPVNTVAAIERLRQEAFDLAGACDRDLVVFRQFVHAQNGDDVLQRLVLLQDRLNLAGDVVMLLADHARVEQARVGVERIHRREDRLFEYGARQNGLRIQMCEGRGGRRVGQIVGRNVNGLHGRDRTLGRRRDAFLQRAHVGGERRLIAHGGRNAAEQGGHFRTGLGKAEDVVDEEEHVLPLVAEMFGDGEA